MGVSGRVTREKFWWLRLLAAKWEFVQSLELKRKPLVSQAHRECHLALEVVWLNGARVKETDYDVVTSTAVRASPVASRNNGNFIVSNIRTIPSPT